MTAGGWTNLGSCFPTELVEARIELHWAAQVICAAADAGLEKRDDDSHSNMVWDRELGALIGRPLKTGKRVGLRPSDFSLIIQNGEAVEAALPIAGEVLESCCQWAQKQLGLDAALAIRDYDMPARDTRVPFVAKPAEMAELGRTFESASHLLGAFAATDPRATEVAIWPHHFDVGGILFLDKDVPAEKAQQIGFGLSPGDGTIAEPYFYITPWPLPPDPEFPSLDGGGEWLTEGFTVLRASVLVSGHEASQSDRASAFVRSAVAAGEQLIARTT